MPSFTYTILKIEEEKKNSVGTHDDWGPKNVQALNYSICIWTHKTDPRFHPAKPCEDS